MKFSVDKELFPYDNKFMEAANGEKVHYIDEGSGQAILMLHGNPTWSFLYRKMIKSLSPHYRCIAPDYPGFGLSIATNSYDFSPSSHANIICELVDHLQLDDFIIVMQDWGGPIGINLAQKFPQRIRGLVLGNTWAWPLNGKLRYEVFSWIMGGPLGRSMANTFNGVSKFFLHKGFIQKPGRQEMVMYQAPFSDMGNRAPTAIFPRQLIQAQEFLRDIEAGLGCISDIPILLLWGNRDFAFKTDQLLHFKKIFRNNEYHSLDAGHFWQDEQGELSSQYIHEWARKRLTQVFVS